MKIVTILGARPQFIKAASVSRLIKQRSGLREIIIHTGQHYDQNMSDVFFQEMKIPKPDYRFRINQTNHGAMTGEMLKNIEEVLLKEKPDYVLVYGDTNSTLAGSLVASKLHIPIVHVEAGLRSFNNQMPEEINRILTDRLSSLLFCPTSVAVENLNKESFQHFDCQIINSGDVMLDGILFYKQFAQKPKNLKQKKEEFVLCTIHRAENTNDFTRLKNILNALNEISRQEKIICPLHPRTKKIIEQNQIQINFEIIEPVGYFEMIWLIENSRLIMTDSGGLQKEAFFLKKNCIVLREETEWIELVDHGFNFLSGTKHEEIVIAYNQFSFNQDFSNKLYGNGEASQKIVESLLNLSS